MSAERHLERAVNGTVQIGPNLARWPGKGKGWRIPGRVVALGVAVFAAWRLGHQWPWLWALMIAGVLGVGYWLGEFTTEPEPAPEEELADVEPGEQLPPAPDPAPQHPELTWDQERQLIIDAVRHLAAGYANVHLADLYAYMDGPAMYMDLSEFRVWVRVHNVPTRDSVKARGLTRVGIRVADLQQPRWDPPEDTPPPPFPVLPPDALQDW